MRESNIWQGPLGKLDADAHNARIWMTFFLLKQTKLSCAGGGIRAGALSLAIHHIATVVVIAGAGVELVSTMADLKVECRLVAPRAVVSLARKRMVNKKATCHR